MGFAASVIHIVVHQTFYFWRSFYVEWGLYVHDGSDKKIFLALDIDIHSWSQYDKWQEPIGNLKIRDRSRGVDQGGSLEAEDRPAELGDLDGIVQTNTLVPVAGGWGGLGEDKLNCFVAGASPLTKQCLEKKVGLYQSSQKDRASHNTGLGSRRGSTGAGSSYIRVPRVLAIPLSRR